MKIRELHIYTSKFNEQLRFYRDTLNLKVKQQDDDHFKVNVGYSVLSFEAKESTTHYHIAFHIPSGMEQKALDWLKNRTGILKNNTEEVIDFRNWLAKSVYFYDKDKNIMEFISRKDYLKPENALFSEESILGIAEIGLATGAIRENIATISKDGKLDRYDGDFKKFCALGTKEGLIIAIDKSKKTWFPTNDKAQASPFKLNYTHQVDTYNLEFKDEKIQIEKDTE